MKKKGTTSVENNNSLFNYILKGGITGILVAYVIIYALRPSVPYPDFIIEIFENYFMFIILLLINFYLFLWDKLIGTLFFVCILSLVFDYFIFIKKDLAKIKKNNNQVVIENFQNSEDIILKKIKDFLGNISNNSYL